MIQEQRTWPGGPVWWTENGVQYVSIPFTWNLPQVRRQLLDGNLFADRTVVGGPAVALMPEYLADVAEIGGDMPGVLQRVNPRATRTTRGCPRRCGFCAVPKLEGPFRILHDWPVLPVICDSNLLAAGEQHFDTVIDRLLEADLTGIDFNQGLDARLLTAHHAKRLGQLPRDTIIRLSWDNIQHQSAVEHAIVELLDAGIRRRQIRCYVLMGYLDTPDDALWRCRLLWRGFGVMPNPQRYNPLDALDRDAYLGSGWIDHEAEMQKLMRYWGRLAYNNGKRYEDFDHTV